jgi:hypothetical protein
MNNRSKWTGFVKTSIGDLGKNLGYMVSASGYKGADQGEFLYDMIWYELGDDGFVLRQQMAMECENNISPSNCVDDDFQKLVQARADVRVWVSTAVNSSDIEQHIRNCESQIRKFYGSQPGDQYVLLFFNWTDRNDFVLKILR